jgi:hypothetical protein
MRRPRIALIAISFVLLAIPARAQSPYVAATIGADIARFSHTESNTFDAPSSDSEAFSWSLRLGTEIGQNWGTELEFVRSNESRSSVPSGVPSPFAANAASASTIAIGGIALPVGNFSADVRSRHTDFDGVAWVRQRAASIDLVYLGGVVFSRQRTEVSETFPSVLRPLVPVPGGVFRTTTIDLSVRPLIGMEARIGLTPHVKLIPGLRLQGVTSGWLVRPYAGLGWSF